MKTELNQGEKLIKKGPANMQRGVETVGGRLYLTDQRLIFEAHAFNVQSGVSEIPIDSVIGVRRAWTKLFGVIPLAPNSVVVTLSEGSEHSFVLARRQSWLDAIGSFCASTEA
jgi:hypothetical protein